MTADELQAERAAAEAALIERHQDEYEDVHNGSGRSEEFPSELAARHMREWEDLERRYPKPAQPAATAPAPALPALKPSI